MTGRCEACCGEGHDEEQRVPVYGVCGAVECWDWRSEPCEECEGTGVAADEGES